MTGVAPGLQTRRGVLTTPRVGSIPMHFRQYSKQIIRIWFALPRITLLKDQIMKARLTGLFLTALLIGVLSIGATDTTSLPQSLDWRDNNGNFVTTPKDEGDCASCWAFAAAAMTESYTAIENGDTDPTIDLSEQALISCSHDGSCSRGGDTGTALDYIRDKGIPDEDCFPYEGAQDDCGKICDDWESRVTKIPGWSWATKDDADTDAIKQALEKGPVTSWMHLMSDFENYTGGVYHCESSEHLGDHFVLLVGWDDADGAWIAKNNWGTDWGDGGFFKIAYGVCGIGQWAARVGGHNAGDDDDDEQCGCGG